MAGRLRRGKHMPIPHSKADDTESESEVSSVDEVAMVEGEPVDEEEDDDVVVAPKTRHRRRRSQVERMEISEEEEEFRPPPTPSVNPVEYESQNSPLDITDPSDLGRHFSELIETCNSLDTGTGYDEQFLRVMSKNIKRGEELFEYIMKGTVEQSNQEGSSGNKRRVGPGDMYLAFLHAKVSSNLIRNKAECIGSGTSIFTVDKYLSSLKNHYVDGDGDYSPTLASANIAMESSHRSLTLNPLIAAVGALDREQVQIPKAKKPRTMPRKDNVEEQQDTSIDDGDSGPQQNQTNVAAENLAKEMNKVLKTVYRQQNHSINLYEFSMDKNSFPKTVENIFYLSFLVKDGFVSLTKDENGKYKDYSLNIKPEKSQRPETEAPEDDEETTRNQISRQKHILTFTKPQWKKFCEMSAGENPNPSFQRWLERQHAL